MTILAQGDSLAEYDSLEARAQSLLDRLNAHETTVTELFSRRDDAKTRGGGPPGSLPPVPPPPTPMDSWPTPGGRLPAPRYDSPDTSPPKPDPDERPATKLPTSIKPEGPLRSEGYYLGFVVAQVIPNNGGVRWEENNPAPPPSMVSKSKNLAFDNGYMVGLLLGKDFGFVRMEAEHSILHYEKARGNGLAEIHPTTVRVILDKELTERLDFRFGIGAGIDLAKITDGAKNYRDVSFCYEFLTGLGVRLNEGLALNLDYRYFLTAASDDYERLQSHLLAAQLQFDL